MGQGISLNKKWRKVKNFKGIQKKNHLIFHSIYKNMFLLRGHTLLLLPGSSPPTQLDDMTMGRPHCGAHPGLLAGSVTEGSQDLGLLIGHLVCRIHRGESTAGRLLFKEGPCLSFFLYNMF